MLAKIEREAARASENGYFDTPFLLSPCGELGVVVAEERALIQAARWAGCSPAEIAIVRGADHLIVEATE